MAQYGPTRLVSIFSEDGVEYARNVESQRMIDAFVPAEEQAQDAVEEERQISRFTIDTEEEDDNAYLIIHWANSYDASTAELNLRNLHNTNVDSGLEVRNSFAQMVEVYATAHVMGLKAEIQGDSLRTEILEFVEEELLSEKMLEDALDLLEFDEDLAVRILRGTYLKVKDDGGRKEQLDAMTAWCSNNGYGETLAEIDGDTDRP